MRYLFILILIVKFVTAESIYDWKSLDKKHVLYELEVTGGDADYQEIPLALSLDQTAKVLTVTLVDSNIYPKNDYTNKSYTLKPWSVFTDVENNKVAFTLMNKPVVYLPCIFYIEDGLYKMDIDVRNLYNNKINLTKSTGVFDVYTKKGTYTQALALTFTLVNEEDYLE